MKDLFGNIIEEDRPKPTVRVPIVEKQICEWVVSRPYSVVKINKTLPWILHEDKTTVG